MMHISPEYLWKEGDAEKLNNIKDILVIGRSTDILSWKL